MVGRGAGPCLVTLVDRRSGCLEGGLAAVETEVLLRHPASRTVTLDRGKEFSSFAEVKAVTGATFNFTPPHHPWQRGTNKNTNGLPREYFPKGTDFTGVGEEEVAKAYHAINERPRKRLGFRPRTRHATRRSCTCCGNSRLNTGKRN